MFANSIMSYNNATDRLDHLDRPDFLKDPVRNYPDRMRKKSIVCAEFAAFCGLNIESPDLKNNENPEFFLEKVDLYKRDFFTYSKWN